MSVELAVLKVMIARLRADATMTGLVSGRVYDQVPAGAARPYVNVRSIQAVDDGADCIDGQEVYLDIDVWSDAVGSGEAGQIASAVRKVLHGASLALDEPYTLTDIEHRDTNLARESDGIMTRARMSFRALVESK